VDGKIDASTANLISEEDYMDICKRSKVGHGDILMPMIGTIGNPVIVKELAPKFAIKNVALIKFKSNSPSNTYINAFLKSSHFYQYVSKLSRGGTQKFLGLGDIRKLPIPMLAKESEVEFCARLQRTTMLREQAILKLAKVNSLVESLQHQVFTTSFN
jgi:type I restriction enzyme S subunit